MTKLWYIPKVEYDTATDNVDRSQKYVERKICWRRDSSNISSVKTVNPIYASQVRTVVACGGR